MTQRSVFSLEMCLKLTPGVYEQFRMLCAPSPTPLAFEEKWGRYRMARDLLLAHESLWHRGCWEFFDEHAKAMSIYQDWAKSMNVAAADPRAAGVVDIYRGQSTYMTYTAVCLLSQGSRSERDLARICTVPEQRLWERDTFRKIIDGLRWVAFPVVVEDAAYVIPGRAEAGLTLEELSQPKYQYLRPIQ